MINVVGIMDDWIEHKAGRLPPGYGVPWGMTLMFILLFPLLFPLQFTNWLALHRADLAALNTAASAPLRQPVVRVNGVVIDSDQARL